MSALKPLGDPNALVCDGDVCVLPSQEASATETGASATQDAV